MHTAQEPLPLEIRTEAQAEWRVDAQTREIGRRGLVEARAALAEARRRALLREAAPHPSHAA
jgi:hypothetical protein